MPSDRRRKSILVVDDDRELLALTRGLLEDEGYEVSTAENGAAALDLLRSRKPDVILLDMRMPVMDGWEFARRLHEAHDHDSALVVMSAAENPAARAAEVRADAWISKPFDLDVLLDVVEKRLPK